MKMQSIPRPRLQTKKWFVTVWEIAVTLVLSFMFYLGSSAIITVNRQAGLWFIGVIAGFLLYMGSVSIWKFTGEWFVYAIGRGRTFLQWIACILLVASAIAVFTPGLPLTIAFLGGVLAVVAIACFNIYASICEELRKDIYQV